MEKNEKICINCKYMTWLVGLGLGIRCSNKESEIGKKNPPIIPSKSHTCDKFEFPQKKED